jgi:hypothetical protein
MAILFNKMLKVSAEILAQKLVQKKTDPEVGF